MFVLVIESPDIFFKTVMLFVTVVTVWTFTFLKHYIMISCSMKDFTVHGRYKTVNTMKLSHKLSDTVCVWLPSFPQWSVISFPILQFCFWFRQFCSVLRESVFVGLKLILRPQVTWSYWRWTNRPLGYAVTMLFCILPSHLNWNPWCTKSSSVYYALWEQIYFL